MENYKIYNTVYQYTTLILKLAITCYDTMSSTSSQSSVAHAEVTALTLASKTPW